MWLEESGDHGFKLKLAAHQSPSTTTCLRSCALALRRWRGIRRVALADADSAQSSTKPSSRTSSGWSGSRGVEKNVVNFGSSPQNRFSASTSLAPNSTHPVGNVSFSSRSQADHKSYIKSRQDYSVTKLVQDPPATFGKLARKFLYVTENCSSCILYH